MVVGVVVVDRSLSAARVKIVPIERLWLVGGLRTAHSARLLARGRGHLCAYIDRRRIHLDTNLCDHGCLQLRWLCLITLLFQLLRLHKCNIVVPGHSLAVSSGVPGCVRDFLHLQEGVWCDLVFDPSVLELLIDVLRVVFFGVHEADILFELLAERLREGVLERLFNFLHCLHVHEKLDQHVISEEACLACAIRKDHDTEAVLDTSVPLAAIDTPVSPVHLTVTRFDIFKVITLVIATACPTELTKAVLHILVVLTLICVCNIFATRLFPNTLAFFHALDEDTRVGISIGPAVLTITICLAIGVLTKINITVGKCVGTLAVT